MRLKKTDHKLFFATDIHGSEICWKKFLASAAYYSADIIVLGGDMTGKALVPIIKGRGGRWRATLLQQSFELGTEAELSAMEAAIASRGYYPFRTDEDEIETFARDKQKIDKLFARTVISTLSRWMDMADRKFADGNVRCFVCPGNDDDFSIDEVIASSKCVIDAEGKIVDLFDGFKMASTGWSNPTPWKTHREENEDALYERISKMLPDDIDGAAWLFSFHAPPLATGLDDAPELDAKLNVLNAGQSVVPVGSSAVRRIIEERKPLVSLHGHIHEAKGVARINKTLCINPGSLYEQGLLQGALLDLDAQKGIRSYVLTTG